MLLPARDTTSLSSLYHLNSEPWIPPTGVFYAPESRAYAASDATLPLPAPQSTPLADLLSRRNSCRTFADRPLSLADLASLLGLAYGIYRNAAPPGAPMVLARGVPSAGGLFPLELFVQARRVEGLADGLYHYHPLDHALEPRPPATWSEATAPLVHPADLDGANVLVYLAAVFTRSQVKYGPRGYRFVLLEAGHVAQTLCLAASELGLGSLCVGGYRDALANRFLGLDVPDEGVVYAVGIGNRVAVG